jgi:hypothetical protein
MHCTKGRPSHIQRCSGLPGMSWPLALGRLQLRVLFATGLLTPALLLVVGEQRGRKE